MHHAYNAYVSKVLELLTASAIPLTEAKHLCRSNLQFLEQSYVTLTDTEEVVGKLMSA